MSRLAEKYNIPIEVVNKMVKDGVISCSWPIREEVFKRYSELKISGLSMEVIYSTISKEKGISESSVRHYIYSLKNL